MDRSPRDAGTGVRAAPRKPLVLIAEDDADLRDLLATWLVDAGYMALAFEDGEDLERWVFEATAVPEVALVIADARMPRQAGLDVLARLHERRVATRFVLITGLRDPAVVAEAKRLGVTYILYKPFTADELRDVVGILVPIDTGAESA